MKQSALKLVNLVKTFGFGNIKAVDNISLSVDKGEIISILGPSGCGKTTTMRVIAGLEQPDSGDVLVDGVSVTSKPVHRRNIGMVFQDLALFPHMTVSQNVEFGLKLRGIKGREAERKVTAALEAVELTPSGHGPKYPSQLSGGQRQRVALARTIVVEPTLVLFDEPMAALDRRLRDRLAVELRRIQKALGVAAVYVTHDQETASTMSDRIVLMSEGAVVQVGSPRDVYDKPVSLFAADFLGEINVLAWEQVPESADYQVLRDLPPGSKIGVRPEVIRMSSERSARTFAQGTLVSAHFMSGYFLYRVELSDGSQIMIRTPQAFAGDVQSIFLNALPGDYKVLG